jgi:HlyD family secretion protein
MKKIKFIIMKSKYLWILGLVFLMACSGEVDESDAFGNFEVAEVIVSSQANGRILELNIEEGQAINSQMNIGSIDSVGLVLKKEQIEETIKAVKSKLENFATQIKVQDQLKANINIEKARVERLLKESAATQKQLDDIDGNLKVLDRQIEAIQSQSKSVLNEISALKKQRDQVVENIRNCQIINPISGTVLTQIAEMGEITGFGKPLYKIANLNQLQLKVYISGNQLAQVKLGQEVQVLIDEGEDGFKHLSGIIGWISSKAEFTPKTIQTKEERVNLVYAMKVNVKNDGSLKIGMPGEIRFKTNTNQ